jgi:hypothetical protein
LTGAAAAGGGRFTGAAAGRLYAWVGSSDEKACGCVGGTGCGANGGRSVRNCGAGACDGLIGVVEESLRAAAGGLLESCGVGGTRLF